MWQPAAGSKLKIAAVSYEGRETGFVRIAE